MIWDGYAYTEDYRDIIIHHYPVSWSFLVVLQLFTDGILGDNGAI